MYNVLILEDDNEFAGILEIYLKKAGYECHIGNTLKEAIELFDRGNFDLILTDMMLPDGSGKDFCKHIRKTKTLPIIIISCLDDDLTIISAFSEGADDYITKPLNAVQFLARIEANLRREKYYNSKQQTVQENHMMFSNMLLDKLHRKIISGDEEIALSPIEFTLLVLFLERPNNLLLYDDLYRLIWDKDSLGDYRSIMVHVSNLKKKIDPHDTGIITNVRGAGYLFSSTQRQAKDK